MTRYHLLSVKLSNSKFNKLKPEIKSGPEKTLNLASNVIVDSTNETYFPFKSLLTDARVSKLRKALANN